MSRITVRGAGKEVFRITNSGQLIACEGMSSDDCTRALFAGMAKQFPSLVAEQAREIERLRDEISSIAVLAGITYENASPETMRSIHEIARGALNCRK